MPMHVAAIILAAYVSLVVELTALHVPSVASSRSVWMSRWALVSGYSPRYRKLFGFGKPAKLMLFALPLVVVYAVFLYPFAVLALGPDPLADYLFAPAPILDAIGLAMLVAGRCVALSAASTVRRMNAQAGASFHLHTSGIYRWSRNPGLVGMYLFIGGVWLTMPSAAMLIGIAVYVAYMGFKVHMEEDFLKNKFGAAYLDYRAKTGRYLP